MTKRAVLEKLLKEAEITLLPRKHDFIKKPVKEDGLESCLNKRWIIRCSNASVLFAVGGAIGLRICGFLFAFSYSSLYVFSVCS